jgi:hypothetical protein
MDDNVWEYPFGDLDDDEDLFFRKPQPPCQVSPWNTDYSILPYKA